MVRREGAKRQRAIGHCRNARGLGKSMVVFRLFEKLRYSNERSTKFDDFISRIEIIQQVYDVVTICTWEED